MQFLKDNFFTILLFTFVGGFFILYGVMSWNEPDYQQYTVKLVYCDNRPAEVKTITVTSGLSPELLTYKQAVPILCFCGRGVDSYKITNVCDYTVVSVKYVTE